jgi:hypothetical protein
MSAYAVRAHLQNLRQEKERYPHRNDPGPYTRR